jgi:SAM-dependent methyltransferase
VTVELGAGNFEHLPFVRHDFDEYVCVDLRKPSAAVLKRLKPYPKASFIVGDAQKVDLPDNYADRVVATCLLMHLPDPIQALREWQRICKPGGIVEFLVPTDPGIAIRLFRRFVSGREVKRAGLTREDYRIISAYDHLSSFHRLLQIARFSTEPSRKLIVRYFPISWLPSFNLNAFAVMRMAPRTT